jgi:hypothetical protein
VEKETLVLKTTFRGIFGDFIKKIIGLIAAFVIYLFGKGILSGLYAKNNIVSIKTSLFEIPFASLSFIIFIYIIYAVLIILSIFILCKLVILLCELKNITIIDFVEEKIETKKHGFLFTKDESQSKFDRIIKVEIEQKMIDRLVNTGGFYVEYLVNSKLDSQLKSFEVMHIEKPFEKREKLI